MKKMLLIDDDKEWCEEIEDALNSAGIAVKSVYDGAAGRKEAEKNLYDIMLIDLKIPGINGFELIKMLRRENVSARIGCVTGSLLGKDIPGERFISENQEKELYDMTDKVFQKPVDIEELIRFVRS
ncbi:MAG: response regulator transcription factor [Candidatus Goldiibacteriota bacterium]